jgi:hypothetical protein
MTITKTTNNNIEGYQILDETCEYFLTEATEALALAKYNAIKLAEAKREQERIAELDKPKVEQPTIQDLAQAVAELSAIVLGGQ